MQLSDGERLIVVMLAEVMEAMGLNGEIDPKLVKTLAYDHDDWAIAHKYHNLFNSEGPSEETVKETQDILWMWQVIESSIEELEGAEAEQAAQFQPHTQFTGFDGNHDPHHGVAHTLIKRLGLFDRFADRNLNSHSQATLPRYRNMLPKFDAAMEGNQGEPLTIEELTVIFA